MSPILKPYGLQLAEVAPSWSQVGPKLGPCWPKLTPSRVAANLDRKGPLGRFWTDLQNVQITTVPIPWSFFAVCSLRKCNPPGIPVWQICPVASTAKLPRLGTFGAGRFISNGPGSDQRPPQVSGPNGPGLILRAPRRWVLRQWWWQLRLERAAASRNVDVIRSLQ